MTVKPVKKPIRNPHTEEAKRLRARIPAIVGMFVLYAKELERLGQSLGDLADYEGLPESQAEGLAEEAQRIIGMAQSVRDVLGIEEAEGE